MWFVGANVKGLFSGEFNVYEVYALFSTKRHWWDNMVTAAVVAVALEIAQFTTHVRPRWWCHPPYPPQTQRRSSNIHCIHREATTVQCGACADHRQYLEYVGLTVVTTPSVTATRPLWEKLIMVSSASRDRFVRNARRPVRWHLMNTDGASRRRWNNQTAANWYPRPLHTAGDKRRWTEIVIVFTTCRPGVVTFQQYLDRKQKYISKK